MTFDVHRGYAGDSPGQRIGDVLARLTSADLSAIVGPRVLPLLPSAPNASRPELIAAAERSFRYRAEQLLSQATLRKTLLRNLDAGKLDELKHRLAEGGIAVSLSAMDVAELTTGRAWSLVAGFFGFAGQELAPTPAPLPREPIRPEFPLFPHQRSIVRRTYQKLVEPRGRTVIHMPTGAGKTRTAMHLVSRAVNEVEPSLIVWLANSRELLEQAAETLEIAWSTLGNREIDVVRFWGSYAAPLEEINEGVVIAGLAKLHFWRERNSIAFLRFASRVRLVIIDEAHQAIAPTYQSLIEGLCGTGAEGRLLGLTATPGRTWNDLKADEELANFFGRSKVVLEVEGYDNPVKYLLEHGYLARPTFRQLEYAPSVTLPITLLKKTAAFEEYGDDVLDALTQDTSRNIAILKAVMDLIDRGHRRIILFALNVAHAQDLASGLAARGIAAEVVSGETPMGERGAILKQFKRPSDEPQVLCNFGVLTTGFDAPTISAAIIARPTKSLVLYSQMVGRATRGVRAGGNETCEIVTVHDPNVPGFGDIAEAFFNWEDVWNDG